MDWLDKLFHVMPKQAQQATARPAPEAIPTQVNNDEEHRLRSLMREVYDQLHSLANHGRSYLDSNGNNYRDAYSQLIRRNHRDIVGLDQTYDYFRDRYDNFFGTTFPRDAYLPLSEQHNNNVARNFYPVMDHPSLTVPFERLELGRPAGVGVRDGAGRGNGNIWFPDIEHPQSPAAPTAQSKGPPQPGQVVGQARGVNTTNSLYTNPKVWAAALGAAALTGAAGYGAYRYLSKKRGRQANL